MEETTDVVQQPTKTLIANSDATIFTIWTEMAKNMTMGHLNQFVSDMTNEYMFTPNTMPIATSIAMAATANALSNVFGINLTAEMKSNIMFQFIISFVRPDTRVGVKLLVIDDLLNVESVPEFVNIIPEKLMGPLAIQAKIRIADADIELNKLQSDIDVSNLDNLDRAKKGLPSIETLAHWRNIAQGIMPDGIVVSK